MAQKINGIAEIYFITAGTHIIPELPLIRIKNITLIIINSVFMHRNDNDGFVFLTRLIQLRQHR